MKRIIFALLLFCFWSVPALGEVIGKEVLYNVGALNLK